MWHFKGHWLVKGRSEKKPANLQVASYGRYRIENDDKEVLASGEFSALQLSDIIAGVPIRFSNDHGQFVLPNSPDALDMIKQLRGEHHWSTRLSFIESNLKYAALACAVIALTLVGFMRFGIPAIASLIAANLPHALVMQLGDEVERIIDWQHMQPTALSNEEIARWNQYFGQALALEPDQYWRIEYRSSESLGANALALPHGVMILTDDLIALAEDPDEVLGVVLHEMGHVVHQHGLRQVIQTSLWTISLAIFTGEVTGVAEWVAGAPAIFASLSYSRDYEFEADAYAARQLRALEKDPVVLATVLNRLTCGEAECGNDPSPLPYLSTHPPTPDRNQRIGEL